MFNAAYALLCSVTLLGTFIWQAVAVYVAISNRDELEQLLQNSKGISLRAPPIDASLMLKTMWISELGKVMMLPTSYLKRGELDGEDWRHFPQSMRRKLKVMCLSIWTLGGAYLILGGMTLFKI